MSENVTFLCKKGRIFAFATFVEKIFLRENNIFYPVFFYPSDLVLKRSFPESFFYFYNFLVPQSDQTKKSGQKIKKVNFLLFLVEISFGLFQRVLNCIYMHRKPLGVRNLVSDPETFISGQFCRYFHIQ